MRSAVLFAAVFGLAAAAPQGFDIDAINALPTPSVLGPDIDAMSATVTYDPTTAAGAAAAAVTEVVSKRSPRRAALNKRTCPTEPGGVGPVPGDGSVAAYLASDSILAGAASSAPVPAGYTQSFSNLQGSTQEIGYITFTTLQTATYDPSQCAAFCDGVNFCLGFNIYFERDPMYTPGIDCPNPAPVTNIKCSVYGYPVVPETATNMGQWRGPEDTTGSAFHVVIAGSNGYIKNNPYPAPALQTNFTGPSALLPGAINAPVDPTTGKNTYLGMKIYNGGPFDPSQCAAACQAQTAYDARHPASDGTYMPCNFFNAYILSKNDVPQGTYCSFYSKSWDASYAKNTGYSSGGSFYAVSDSYTYTLTNLDPGKK
ncbi:hypothetical protein K432DRAFT_333149, partial [Lepidopterella palustris CBS 459.81]